MDLVPDRVTLRDTAGWLRHLHRSRDGRLLLGFVFVTWAAFFVANWVFNGLLVAVVVGVTLIAAALALWHIRRRLLARRDSDS